MTDDTILSNLFSLCGKAYIRTNEMHTKHLTIYIYLANIILK